MADERDSRMANVSVPKASASDKADDNSKTANDNSAQDVNNDESDEKKDASTNDKESAEGSDNKDDAAGSDSLNKSDKGKGSDDKKSDDEKMMDKSANGDSNNTQDTLADNDLNKGKDKPESKSFEDRKEDAAKAIVKATHPEAAAVIDKVDDSKVGQAAKKTRKFFKRTQAALNGALTGLKMYGMAQALAFMKAFFMAIMNGIQAAASAIAGFFSAVGTFIVNAAATLGISVLATSIAVCAGPALLVGAIVAGVAASVTSNAQRDEDTDKGCKEDVQNLEDAGETDDSSDDSSRIQALKSQYSKQTASVFKELGYDNEHIAGILGNWFAESGCDPTSIETIYDEKYQIGSKKRAAMSNWQDFTLNTVFPSYQSANVSINRSAYKGSDGKYYPGLGLGGFTGPNTTDLLSFAQNHNKQWYDFDLQLMFVITPYSHGGYSVDMNNIYGNVNYGTPEDAATAFLHNWEGNTIAEAERRRAAKDYFTELHTMQLDSQYAQSIIAQANASRVNGNNNAISNAIDGCSETTQVYNNSSIAAAAASFAWDSTDLGMHNNGTELYKQVHDGVIQGDNIYKSCDRTVCSAVRWSGADDSYPPGHVGVQLSYVLSDAGKEKWKEINYTGEESLEPGDIIFEGENCTAHTLIYCGPDIIKSLHPNTTGLAIVSGSYADRSPGCGSFYNSSPRRVFRNIKKETNSAYTNVAASSRNFTTSSSNTSATSSTQATTTGS